MGATVYNLFFAATLGINTMRPSLNGRHLADNILHQFSGMMILLFKISLYGPINCTINCNLATKMHHAIIWTIAVNQDRPIPV